MNPFDFTLFVLALLACHRIWHYEVIFSYAQSALRLGGWWAFPLTCPSCSPVWIALALALLWPQLPMWVIAPLAAYPFARLMAFAYRADWEAFLPGRAARLQQALDQAVARHQSPAAPPVRIEAGCASCGHAGSAANANAAADLAIVVDADAPASVLVRVARTVKALEEGGLTATLAAATPSVALQKAAADAALAPDSVVTAPWTSLLHSADVLVVHSPTQAGAASEAARYGMAVFAHKEANSAAYAPTASVFTGDTALNDADQLVEALLATPYFRARKAATRAWGFSPAVNAVS